MLLLLLHRNIQRYTNGFIIVIIIIIIIIITMTIICSDFGSILHDSRDIAASLVIT